MRFLALYGVADGFITEKVSSIAIVLRKYQVRQLPSSKEPHLAREP